MASGFPCHQDQFSLVSDLLAHVDDMNDVELVSNDGHIIGANKYILGARSPVFRRDLSNKNRLKLYFSRMVVEAMVEYCRSNQLTKIASSISLLRENPRELVHILEIAHFFQLPGLANQTLALTEALLREDCHLACPLLDEAGDDAGDITKLALQTIADHPRKALLHQKHKVMPLSVLQLSHKTLLQLCQYQDLNCTESFLFHVLLKWLEFHGDEQKMEVERCVKSLDLCYMKPSFLTDTVVPSGLLPRSKIDDAFRQIAIDTEHSGNKQLYLQTRRERYRHNSNLKMPAKYQPSPSPRGERAAARNDGAARGTAFGPPYQATPSPYNPRTTADHKSSSQFVEQQEDACTQSLSGDSSLVSTNSLQEDDKRASPRKPPSDVTTSRNRKQKRRTKKQKRKKEITLEEENIDQEAEEEDGQPMGTERSGRGSLLRLVEQLDFDNVCCGPSQ